MYSLVQLNLGVNAWFNDGTYDYKITGEPTWGQKTDIQTEKYKDGVKVKDVKINKHFEKYHKGKLSSIGKETFQEGYYHNVSGFEAYFKILDDTSYRLICSKEGKLDLYTFEVFENFGFSTYKLQNFLKTGQLIPGKIPVTSNDHILSDTIPHKEDKVASSTPWSPSDGEIVWYKKENKKAKCHILASGEIMLSFFETNHDMVLVEITIIEKYEQQDLVDQLTNKLLATKGHFFQRDNTIVLTTGSMYKDSPTFEAMCLTHNRGEIKTYSKVPKWKNITNEFIFKIAEFL